MSASTTCTNPATVIDLRRFAANRTSADKTDDIARLDADLIQSLDVLVTILADIENQMPFGPRLIGLLREVRKSIRETPAGTPDGLALRGMALAVAEAVKKVYSLRVAALADPAASSAGPRAPDAPKATP